MRVVILSPTGDIVERIVVIHCDFVKLSQRQIRFEIVRLTTVPGFVNTAIAAKNQVLRIIGINDQGMVVDMLVRFSERTKRLPAIFGYVVVGIQRINSAPDG